MTRNLIPKHWSNESTEVRALMREIHYMHSIADAESWYREMCDEGLSTNEMIRFSKMHLINLTAASKSMAQHCASIKAGGYGLIG